MTREIHIGDIVRHFKESLLRNRQQNICIVLLLFAVHSETGEQLVVYQALYAPFKTCARPYAMFMSAVDREKYPHIKQQYRFEVIQAADACLK